MYSLKDLSLLKDFNNQLNKIYSEYIITDKNYIFGISKKFKISYYNGTIMFPELINTLIKPDHLAKVLRGKKTEFEFTENEMFIRLDDHNIAYKLKNMNNSYKMLSKLLESFEISDNDLVYEFSESEIKDLIDYKMLRLKPAESYHMYITISEFPFLKKFKKLTAYIKISDEEYFDVIFKTYNDSDEEFCTLKRFLKL